MHKLRPYPDHITTSLVWTDRFSEKIKQDQNAVCNHLACIKFFLSSALLGPGHILHMGDVISTGTCSDWRNDRPFVWNNGV